MEILYQNVPGLTDKNHDIRQQLNTKTQPKSEKKPPKYTCIA